MILNAFSSPVVDLSQFANLALAARLPAAAPDFVDFQEFGTGDLVGALAGTLEAESLTRVLYPDDSTSAGQELSCRNIFWWHVLDRLPTVSYDWPIERNCKQAGWPIRNDLEPSIAQLKAATQLYLHSFVGTPDLPWVTVAQPIVGIFLLPTVRKRLTKHFVLVAQAVTSSR